MQRSLTERRRSGRKEGGYSWERRREVGKEDEVKRYGRLVLRNGRKSKKRKVGNKIKLNRRRTVKEKAGTAGKDSYVRQKI